MKTIVISAVNIRKGGTLTILKQCLECLSGLSETRKLRVIALVHRKELACYPNIEYIEMPNTVKSWGRRLWCEYVTMHRISRELAPIYLWFSLHDTTPRVKAEIQAVYCQTSFPFLRWKWQDLRFDYKIVLFALFTKQAYRINIKKNKYLIVQTDWLRKCFSQMFGLPESIFIVAPPKQAERVENKTTSGKGNAYTFLFASTPDCHKNFELLCLAAQLLEKEIGEGKFNVTLTIAGTENKYAKWLYKEWGNVKSLKFAGFMKRDKLYEHYANADCLIFPSRIETWGLPISEFAQFGKPMLLADLPYAHETAMGSKETAFFNTRKACELKEQMKRLVLNDNTFLATVPERKIAEPVAYTWKDLFDKLLNP